MQEYKNTGRIHQLPNSLNSVKSDTQKKLLLRNFYSLDEERFLWSPETYVKFRKKSKNGVKRILSHTKDNGGNLVGQFTKLFAQTIQMITYVFVIKILITNYKIKKRLFLKLENVRMSMIIIIYCEQWTMHYCIYLDELFD